MLQRIIALALLWLLHLPAYGSVGMIDSIEGNVRVVSAIADRTAQTGMELNEGDTVKTGDNAWALLTMSDGASLTLRQDSQVQLTKYRYNPDGNATENSSVLNLLKGAIRSITGYIGRTNRAGYMIQTPTATIGIRGTDHEPAYYPTPGPGQKLDHEPGTYDKVNDGESFIRNPKGEVPVKPGQTAFVHQNGSVAPRLLARPPAFYTRHAEFDKKAAVRRQQFHQRFEQQYQRHAQERAQRQQGGPNEKQQFGQSQKGQQHDLQEKRQQHMQQLQQRRELMQQQQKERQAAQQQRSAQQAEAQKERQRERELKKEHENGKHLQHR